MVRFAEEFQNKKKKKEEPEHNVFGRCGVKNLSAIAGSLVSVDGIHFCKQFWVPHLIHQVSSSQLLGAARSTSSRRCCRIWPSPPGFTKSLARTLLLSSSSGVVRGSIERRYFARVSSSEGTGNFGRVCCNERVAMAMRQMEEDEQWVEWSNGEKERKKRSEKRSKQTKHKKCGDAESPVEQMSL